MNYCTAAIGAPRHRRSSATEAEAVAFVVSHAIGPDTGAAASDYIQLYAGDKETLLASLGAIQHAATEILTALHTEAP